jgi:hypothetical protein
MDAVKNIDFVSAENPRPVRSLVNILTKLACSVLQCY